MTPLPHFIAPSLSDLPHPVECLWEHYKVSPEALDVGEYMAIIAEPANGEAIERMNVICSDLGLEPIRVMGALLELQESGIIAFTIGQPDLEDGLVFCFFEIDTDLYYGDDNSPPADALDSLSSGWDEYPDDPEDDVPVGIIAPGPLCPPVPSNKRRARIYAKTNGYCFYCIEAWASHLDHMHPKIRGGGNEDENMIGACRSCNVRKNDRTVEEYRAYLAHRNRHPDISHVKFYGEANQ